MSSSIIQRDLNNGDAPPKTLAPPPHNELALTLDTIDLTDEEVLALVRRAIDQVFDSRKAAAYHFHVPESRLSHWLNPESRERLPAYVFRHTRLFHVFARLMLERRGYVVQQPTKWTWLKLRACRMARAMLRRVERQLKEDLGNAAAL